MLRTLVDVYSDHADEVKDAAPAAEQPKAEDKPVAAGGDQLKAAEHKERSRSRSRYAKLGLAVSSLAYLAPCQQLRSTFHRALLAQQLGWPH